jgi:hypothetical protein
MIDRVDQCALLVEEYTTKVRWHLKALEAGEITLDAFASGVLRLTAALETAFGIQPASTSSQR